MLQKEARKALELIVYKVAGKGNRSEDSFLTYQETTLHSEAFTSVSELISMNLFS